MTIVRVFCLTGRIHSGKTTLLHDLCRRLRDRTIRLNGLLSPAFFENGKHKGYDGYILPSGRTFPLIRTLGNPDWKRIGRFFILPEGFQKAQEAIRNYSDSDLSIIDEMGPLELAGDGFWPAFSTLIQDGRPTLAVIRESLIASFRTRVAAEIEIFALGTPGLIDIMAERLECLRQ